MSAQIDTDPPGERDKFEAAYAERSGTTVAALRALGQRAEPCDCGDPGCEGWAMVTVRRLDPCTLFDLGGPLDGVGVT